MFFLVVGLINSFAEAVSQFVRLWYWIILLTLGFGTQVSLFAHIKLATRARAKGLAAEVAASGSLSTASMIACCTHYLAGLLPFLGLSSIALFMTKYQVPFLVVGISSSMIGIVIMLSRIKRHRLVGHSIVLRALVRPNMKTLLAGALVLGVVIATTSFFVVDPGETFAASDLEQVADNDISADSTPQEQNQLDTRIDDRNGVRIEVFSDDFGYHEPFALSVRYDTHSGALDFKVNEISYLEDEQGTRYDPLRWQGDPPGGHHRSGKLIFAALKRRPASIRLVMENVYGVTREFVWEIPVGWAGG
jgi:hypothetical protein